MRNPARYRFCLVSALLLAVGFPAMLGAQDLGGIEHVSRNPIVIASQLRLAANLGQAAIRRLSELQPDELLDDPIRLAREVYVLIRAAYQGLEANQREKRFGDPLLDYQVSKLKEAWDISRRPVDSAVNSLPRQEYVANSIRDLTSAISIVQQVVELMP